MYSTALSSVIPHNFLSPPPDFLKLSKYLAKATPRLRSYPQQTFRQHSFYVIPACAG
jgi:hypothetical protein